MDHIARPLHILLAEKEGRIWFDIICLKIYQFERITWWGLSILESAVECIMEYALQYVMLGKYFKIMGDHETLSIVHHVWLHVDFSIHEVFFGPLGLHLRVWSELGWSPPFRPMTTLRLKWLRAYNLVCDVALSPKSKSHEINMCNMSH